MEATVIQSAACKTIKAGVTSGAVLSQSGTIFCHEGKKGRSYSKEEFGAVNRFRNDLLLLIVAIRLLSLCAHGNRIAKQ
jgi:hypothetical protein